MITIPFEITRDGHTFVDAIVLPNNHSMTESEIEAEKQRRFTQWYGIVTANNTEG